MRTLLLIVVVASIQAAPPSHSGQSSRTQVVLLGTGSPPADPLRSGPATAIVVNDRAYLIDLGPGVVRRAAAAAREECRRWPQIGCRPPSSPTCTPITPSAIRI